MDYEKLKEVIAKKIKENGREEITGPVLQMVLMAMVDSLGEVYPQTYTDEEKAQARANIDALSNYDGEITKEKLSLEVQAILNDVANKQNITDESLATIAKTIVGAINELFNGGVKDKSIGVGKLARAVQDTLGKVGMNIKVLPKGTNLLSADLEDGIWLVTDPNSYTNPPSWFSGNSIALLVVNRTTNSVILIGHDGSSNELPAWASRYLSSTSGWRGAEKELEEIFAKKNEIVARILPKKSNLYDDTIEEGIYALYADYYAYENFPNGMNRERPALLLRMANMFCIIGADGNTSNPYPFYAWRYTGMSSWSATPLSDRLNEKLDNTSTLTDTEVNNIWDNN